MARVAKVIINSHNLVFTKMQPLLKEALKDYCRNFISYKKIKRGRDKRVLLIKKDIYAASTIDRNEIRFHLNVKEDIFKYLKNLGFKEESFDIIYSENYSGQDVTFPIKDKRVPYDYQKNLIDYLVNPGRTKVITLETGGGKGLVSLRAVSIIGKRLMLTVLGRYVKKWIKELEETFHLKKGDLLVIRGSKDLISLMNHATSDTLTAKIIIITSTTMSNYIKDYEAGGIRGYPVKPDNMYQHLKVGIKIVDECFEDGSEILTPKGFVSFQDLTEDDLVAQCTLTGEIEFVKPSRIISKQYKGEMYVLDNDQFYSSVTPGHRRVFQDTDGKIIVKEAKDGFSTEHYIPRSGTKVKGKSVPKELIQLVVILQAEAYRRNVNDKESWHFTLKKINKVACLNRLLSTLNIPFTLKRTGLYGYYTIYIGSLKELGIETILDETRTFNRAEILSWDRESLEIFRKELINRNDSIFNNDVIYYTSNKENAETACLVGHLTNLGVEITSIAIDENGATKTQYRVCFIPKNHYDLSTAKNETVSYDGKVHCVTVPSGMIMVRQRGCIHISGNCHQFFHLNFKMDLYANVPKEIFLSATLEPSDGFLDKMYKIVYPLSVRMQGKAKDRYTDVVALSYRINGSRYIRCKRNGSYSHALFENEIMRYNRTLMPYLKFINKIVENSFLRIKKEGQKMLIFAATVEMCARISDYLMTQIKDHSIAKYTAEDDYDVLHNNDIVVSTLGSAGTAEDIINLKTCLMTVSVSSIQQNIQALGRLRKLVNYPGDNPEFIYIYSSDIERQRAYHLAKYDTLKEHCRSHKNYDTHYMIEFSKRK